ncbi:MAG: hypothetical protein K0R59_202 [Sphingobacterium sp.]|jgi:hypothetical protein|nr:hypothetical protein [Sphingobacterium sp.]
MKKRRLCGYLQLTLAFLFCIACNKDNGNYQYNEVNRLTVSDQYGNQIDNNTYSLPYGIDFALAPVVKGSIDSVDESNLGFYWIFNSDTVSREKVFRIKTSDLGFDQKSYRLLIVDHKTTLFYSCSFSISVKLMETGSLILTTNEQKETNLFVLSSYFPFYLPFPAFGGIKLGDNPIDLSLSFINTSDFRKSYEKIFVSTEQGRFPIIELDFDTFSPQYSYPAIGSVISGEALLPTFSSLYNAATILGYQINGTVLINGKCHTIVNHRVSGDVYRSDPIDYNFGKDAVTISKKFGGYVLAGFDQKNQRIRVFANEDGVGLYTTNFDYLIPAQLTQGHQFVAATDIVDPALSLNQNWRWQFLTRRASTIYLFDLFQESTNFKEIKQVASKSVPEITDAVSFRYNTGYWYFAKGRTIYRFADNGLDITTYLTLPNDGSGAICTWNFYTDIASNLKNIGIATYNPDSTAPLKGSYYIYNTDNKQFDRQDRNVIDKAVDLELCL